MPGNPPHRSSIQGNDHRLVRKHAPKPISKKPIEKFPCTQAAKENGMFRPLKTMRHYLKIE
jgi:hypothetical protein